MITRKLTTEYLNTFSFPIREQKCKQIKEIDIAEAISIMKKRIDFINRIVKPIYKRLGLEYK